MKEQKRGRGRPKKPPYDLEAERAKVTETLKQRRAERLGIADIDVEEHVDRVMALSHRNKLSKQELDELRETSQALYARTIEVERELEAYRNERYISTMRAAAIEQSVEGADIKHHPMSWEDWCREHNLRYNGKKKPGPAKKKPKAIWDIPAGERGTATKPSEPIDLTSFEEQWMDAQVEKRKEEDRYLKGKRLRNEATQLPTRPAPKNFWI